MSHLSLVVVYKENLKKVGVVEPSDQQLAIAEAFIRGIIRNCYRTNPIWTAECAEKAWVQLDKWNCVSPIPAPYIQAVVERRVNGIRAALANTGTLPLPIEYDTVIDTAQGPVSASNVAGFHELVEYLMKELECDRG